MHWILTTDVCPGKPPGPLWVRRHCLVSNSVLNRHRIWSPIVSFLTNQQAFRTAGAPCPMLHAIWLANSPVSARRHGHRTEEVFGFAEELPAIGWYRWVYCTKKQSSVHPWEFAIHPWGSNWTPDENTEPGFFLWVVSGEKIPPAKVSPDPYLCFQVISNQPSSGYVIWDSKCEYCISPF